jgi:hypothetical protein
VSAEQRAQGAWSCASCGTANEADAAACRACERVRPESDERAPPVVCPACKAKNAAGAVSCAECGWPFPVERRGPVPGLYMGREAALHDAAEREAPVGNVGNAWVLWMAVQIVCALLFLAFVGGFVFLRVRPPGGLWLVVLAVVLVVGARALWRFAAFLDRRRS